MGNFRRVYLNDFPCQMCRKPFRVAVQFKTGDDWNLDEYENGQLVPLDYVKGRGGLHLRFHDRGVSEEGYCPECFSKYREDIKYNCGLDLRVRVAPSGRIWVQKPRRPRGFTIEEYRERQKRVAIWAKKEAARFNKAFSSPSPKLKRAMDKAAEAGSNFIRHHLSETSIKLTFPFRIPGEEAAR